MRFDFIPCSHQRAKVTPHGVPLRRGDATALAVRVHASAEKQLRAIDVADSGDHRLVHEQSAYRLSTGRHARPGPFGIGVRTERIGTEPGEQLRSHIADR